MICNQIFTIIQPLLYKIVYLVHEKNTGLYGTVYDFIVDYGDISVDNILNIDKYLIRKHNIV